MKIEHVVFLGATAATVAGAVLDNEKVQMVAKPLIAPALAVRVLRRRSNRDAADTALLLGSLAAATVGDVLMIDPDDDTRLTNGARAFAVMQLGYSAVLARRGARPTAPALVPRLLGWLGAAGLLRARARTVAPTLTGYGAALGTTSTLSADPALAPEARVVAGTVVPNGDARSRLALGGLLFTGSDALIVVRRLFVRGRTGRRAVEGVVLASYAAAQALLVEGMTE
ncbi:lysoplasmalogenase family protein [Rhodococcus sp. NPDC003318]|uniref:lysoplasmalogenase family protein n=1 Tax=Rhodococcus sp. NPDC003318 TaxID=3364503 RepID=UPI00368447A5